MVVLPNVNVVNCVSASGNQIPGNREDLVGDSAVRIGSTNGGVQPGMPTMARMSIAPVLTRVVTLVGWGSTVC